MFLKSLLAAKEDGLLNKHAHAEEGFIVYNGGCPPRAGRTRKVPLQAKNVETFAMGFPVQRSKVQTTKKETYACCGEASTYSGRYSGVDFRPCGQLPFIPQNDKKAIVKNVPDAPDDWADRNDGDVPLFWMESKSIGLWGALLDEFKITACFDVTAGSGALMEACISRGTLYHGLCCLALYLSLIFIHTHHSNAFFSFCCLFSSINNTVRLGEGAHGLAAHGCTPLRGQHTLLS